MRLLLAAIALLAAVVGADAASLLPPGKLCLYDANGDPLADGTIDFYVPNTTTPKTTWRDPGETILNTNPVVLDSAGCAVVYGAGVYRQRVRDSLGNPIWDQLTSDPGLNGVLPGGPAGGTGNDQVITAEGFALIDGQMVTYLATQTNTGPMTLDPGTAFPPLPFIKDTLSGPAPMSGGEVVTGNVVNAVYSTFDNSFHMVAPPFATSGPTAVIPAVPGGRLSLVNGSPVMTDNVAAAASTTLYYVPFTGSTVPIWNGSLFVPTTFSQLTLQLDATNTHGGYHAASFNFDVFVILDINTVRLCTGPAWAADGVTRVQVLSYQFGVQSNLAPMSCRWGSNSTDVTAVPAHAATYVGTVRMLTDGHSSWIPNPPAAAVGAAPSGGPSTAPATMYVWNNYNRVGVKALVFDTTLGAAAAPTFNGYIYASATVRSANGSVNNRVSYVSGDITDAITVIYKHRMRSPAVVNAHCFFGVGLDTTAGYFNGIFAEIEDDSGTAAIGSDEIVNLIQPLVGVHFLQALEHTNAAGQCIYLPNGVLQALMRM